MPEIMAHQVNNRNSAGPGTHDLASRPRRSMLADRDFSGFIFHRIEVVHGEVPGKTVALEP